LGRGACGGGPYNRRVTTNHPQTGEDNTLYVIDGHAQIFRAFFAIRGGMNSPVTGEPTNATFGFTGMLLKLLTQFRPRYVVMAIDMQGKTFRDELYDQYKATRPPMPDDLRAQEQRIFEITRLLGIPVFGVTGAEADDVIATIVDRVLADPACDDVRVRVVSKDKDLEQLLGPRVTLFDIHTDTTLDAATLQAQKGIAPEQVVDVLALIGDKVDNIPGVEGVGPKTAAQLIAEYGSIDGIYAHLDQIKGKRRENLEKARPFMDVSRRLVALKRDVPVDFDMAKARIGGVDAASLRRVFKEMGFNRHLADLDRLLGSSEPSAAPDASAATPTKAAKKPADALPVGGLFDMGAVDDAAGERRPDLATAEGCDYRAVVDAGQLQQLVTDLRGAEIVSLDTETIGLGHRALLAGLSFAWKSGHGVYVPLRSTEPASHLDEATVLAALKPVLEDPAVAKTGHNLKYDILVLRAAGVEVRGVVFDSMIGSFLLGNHGHGLDHLAMAVLQREMIPITSLIGPAGRGLKQKTIDQAPLDQVTRYAAEDADVALQLYHLFAPQLRAMGMTELAQRIEMPLVETLADMEWHGVRVDPDILAQQQKVLVKRIDELRDAIYGAVGRPFNIDSPKQLADVLFRELGLPVVKKTKTGPSTDSEVLEKLADLDAGDSLKPIDPKALTVPRLVVEYRQFTKLVNTYLEALREAIDKHTGRVHATFHQTGAATGRLSSSGPNLQNIPIRTEVGRDIRRAFIAEPGHRLISADYSQIELRMLAHLSDDASLIDAFARELDVHTAVAAEVFHVPPEQVTREQRGHAKVINFGIIYGVTAYGLARRIDGLDIEGAKKLIADYRARFAGIDAFLGQCVRQATEVGYVTTMLGRRRRIEKISSRNPQDRALSERLAINTVVQGSAADLIKLAMVNLHRRIREERLPMKLLLQIHDELVCEAPADDADRCAAIVQHEMEHAQSLKVPLKTEVGVGADWYASK
jgi:DNA polymerase-1